MSLLSPWPLGCHLSTLFCLLPAPMTSFPQLEPPRAFPCSWGAWLPRPGVSSCPLLLPYGSSAGFLRVPRGRAASASGPLCRAAGSAQPDKHFLLSPHPAPCSAPEPQALRNGVSSATSSKQVRSPRARRPQHPPDASSRPQLLWLSWNSSKNPSTLPHLTKCLRVGTTAVGTLLSPSKDPRRVSAACWGLDPTTAGLICSRSVCWGPEQQGHL